VHPRRIYSRRSALLSAPELKFFHTHQRITESQFALLAKVRLADLVYVHGLNGRRWWRAFAQLSQKHVDFVVADPTTFQVLAAIELDDRSHDRPERRQRDQLINGVFLQAHIPLLRFPLNYSAEQIRRALHSAIGVESPELLNGSSASRSGSDRRH
jgi:Protein of unknown function (DUF2726)